VMSLGFLYCGRAHRRAGRQGCLYAVLSRSVGTDALKDGTVNKISGYTYGRISEGRPIGGERARAGRDGYCVRIPRAFRGNSLSQA
jgi:hypothetical protein